MGNTFRLHAWGALINSTSTYGDAIFRLYLNTGNPATIGGANIGNTGAASNIIVSINITKVWHFIAQITILSLSDLVGNPGTALCAGLFENLDPVLGAVKASKMVGGPVSFDIDTDENNYLELTAQVGTAGSVVLTQATVEFLNVP